MTPDIRKERETALYEAALRLIAKGVNPAAMKVQQIADEAGIGKGTVYEYFASKDEILQGMALYCFDTEIARIAVLMERICFRSSVVAVKIIFLLNLWWRAFTAFP